MGMLYEGDEALCFTLEDALHAGPKIYGATAIPEGTYPVILTPSTRFKRIMPLVQNVPNFTGIRIHPGNTAENTEGCILVGTYKGEDFVGNSRVAFNALFDKIERAINDGDTVFLEVANN